MKIISESVTIYTKRLTEEENTPNSDNVMLVKDLSSMTVETFNKISYNKFTEETLTDLDLPLSNYIAVEEYMDSFIDWAILKINEEDKVVLAIVANKPRNEQYIELFKQYLLSQELEDNKKELENLPEVKQAIGTNIKEID